MWQFLLDIVAMVVIVMTGGAAGSSTATTTDTTPEIVQSEWQTVERVIDGDTIDVSSGERVRLLGVDTPERGECYFQRSTDFVHAWLEGEVVRLESDVRERDRYDRLLRYVFIDTTPDGSATTTEQLVNLVLVQEGYAASVPIGPDRRYRSAFYAAQQEAQTAGRGRWGVCE